MRKGIELKKIHAFADDTSEGNPAGYVFNRDTLSETDMQQLATELEGFVSEVVYIKDGKGDIDFELRFFSCEREVPFCGHGTLATICYEIETNVSIRNKEIVRISTNKGILDITNKYEDMGGVFINAPAQEVIPADIDVRKLAKALNISITHIDSTRPIEIINSGLNTLLVPLLDSEYVIGCSPDYQTIRDFCLQNNAEIVNIFTDKPLNNSHKYRTRIFAPTFGYLEDPATGSGNSALGYYLSNNNLWDGEEFIIEQGTSAQSPNLVYISRSSTDPSRVMFGGRSIIKFEGTYYL